MPGPPTAGFSHWGSSHRQWQTPAAGLGKQQLTARSGVACDGAALTSGGSGGCPSPRKWQISNGKPTSPKRHRPQPEPGATTETRHRGGPGAATASGKSPMASKRRPSATGHSQSRVRQRRPGTVGVRGPSRRQWQNQPEPRSWGSGGRPAARGKTNPSPGRGGPGVVPPPVAKPTPAPVVGVRGSSRRPWQYQPQPRSWGSGGRPAARGNTNPSPGRGGPGAV